MKLRSRGAGSRRVPIFFITVPLVFALAAGLAIAAGSLRHHSITARSSSASASASGAASPSASGRARAASAHHKGRHQHRGAAMTVPTGLTARAVSATRVSLSWHRPSARVAVASYVVYRDGARVGTSSTPSFRDAGVRPGVTYSYRISVKTRSGKVGVRSAAAVVTTHPTTTTGGGAKPVPPPSGFPRAANTGYEHAPGYPGHLKNCSGQIRSNTTYKFCDFSSGVAIGSAHSHPVNVTFIGCRFASNAVADANVADYGSHVVFSYSTFEPSTVSAGPGPTSPYATPIDYHRGYQYGIDQRYAGSLTVDHGNFWGFAEAIEFGYSSQAQPVVVSNSWIHNPRAPGSIDHTDGILENYGGVSYMVFHHNSIVGNGNTNALALQGSSPYRHVTITNNYFSGYGYMVNSGQNMPSTGMVFVGNVWGTDFRPVWGPLYGGAMFTTRGLGSRWARNTIRVRAGTKWMSARNNGLYWWPIDGDPSSSHQVIGHKRDFPGA
jgi:hypothetical protein